MTSKVAGIPSATLTSAAITGGADRTGPGCSRRGSAACGGTGPNHSVSGLGGVAWSGLGRVAVSGLGRVACSGRGDATSAASGWHRPAAMSVPRFSIAS
ncbi:MAG TPA: hypothetical protein VGS06_13195 [Streptosporangiaceae bacterium]|nr:hypothetical protein [Streptosporangiaceae bacterium]